MRICVTLCLALLSAAPAFAATVESVTVENQDGRYSVSMRVLVAVSATDAYNVMTDFEALPQVNPTVVMVERLSENRLHTLVEMCISLFCREIEQVQQFQTETNKTLQMRIIPEESDFRYGIAQWRFSPITENSSRLEFDAVLEPNFWIPPLIGPWLVKRKLQQEAQITSEGIERVALETSH